MKLSALLKDISYVTARGSLDVEVTGIPRRDSREVKKGELFFAVRGKTYDGHEFIQDAVKNGAVAVICEELPVEASDKATYVVVESTRQVISPIAAAYFDHPSKKMKVVGVTGTNGKTTVATLLHQLFGKLGYKVGLISTVENKVIEEPFHTTWTTPDPIVTQEFFAKMVDAGCTHCFIEVTSHAVHQHRVSAIDFTGAIFTNITHDHISYHGSFENYRKAKQGFFDMLHAHAFALINRDDPNGESMLAETKAAKHSYALKSEADFMATIVANEISGLTLKIDGKEIKLELIGEFNAYNLLAVYGAALLLDEDKEKVLDLLPTLTPPRGRFQLVEIGGRIGIVDYAHTPDGLEKVLEAIQAVKKENKKVITITGCGGNRDRAKRPMMARIAYDLSDVVILTADNPRNEDPEVILDEMETGLENPKNDQKVIRISDRKKAIQKAVELAREGDIIFVAGKGHETYQEINGKKTDFDDKKILEEFLQKI